MPRKSSRVFTNRCPLCEFATYHRSGFTTHLVRMHAWSREHVVRTFYATHDEMSCQYCGKATKFLHKCGRFAKYCSTSCQMRARYQDPEFMEYWRKKKSADGLAFANTDAGRRQHAEAGRRLSGILKVLHRQPGFTEARARECSEGLKRKWKDRAFRDSVSSAAKATSHASWSKPRFRKMMSEVGKSQARNLLKPEVRERAISKSSSRAARDKWRRTWLANGNRELYSKRAVAMMADPNCDFGKARPVYLQYGDYTLRSSWELQVAKFLDYAGLEWLYEPHTFQLDDGRRYTPDFYLPSLHMYLEVKPSRFVAKFLDQARCVRDNGYEFRFITKETWRRAQVWLKKNCCRPRSGWR